MRIAIIACLDTKGEEAAFLRRAVEAAGAETWVLDAGVLGDPDFVPDTSAEELARAAGTTLAELRAAGDRGEAVRIMGEGARRVLVELHREGRVQGALAAGGAANTSIAAHAMRALPFGLPKVIVSTLASGDVSSFVGTRDLTLLYPVVDIAGLNRISRRVLEQAARAVTAMAAPPADAGEDRPIIAATMFGVTTPCVTAARRLLEERGYEVLVFHATGAGGRAMEELIADGFVAGVLDLTLTELADELVGGILSAGPDRLRAAGRAGIPQVVAPGAVDMVNFGPFETVPEAFRARQLYRHNPSVTLLRTTAEENAEIGRRAAARLRESLGPVKVLLPEGGVSLYAKPSEPFHDPSADEACHRALEAGLEGSEVRVERRAEDLNDPAFARRAAEALLEMLEG